MIDVTPFEKLGQMEIDWLRARYHFSFAHYTDPARMGFGPLRVWNDDTIRAGGGFEPHPHRDMEIITYVRKGAISHADSLGNQGRTEAGDVQVMSAGRGIVHSEFNHEDEDTTLFQIWIEPRHSGLEPRWATRSFPAQAREAALVPLASGRNGVDALPIDQDATLFGATLAPGQTATHVLEPGRRAYLVAARGTLDVNGTSVTPRAGAAITDESMLTIRAVDDAEVVLLDLP